MKIHFSNRWIDEKKEYISSHIGSYALKISRHFFSLVACFFSLVAHFFLLSRHPSKISRHFFSLVARFFSLVAHFFLLSRHPSKISRHFFSLVGCFFSHSVCKPDYILMSGSNNHDWGMPVEYIVPDRSETI